MPTANDRIEDEQPLPLPAIQPLAKKSAHAALHRRLLEEGVDEAAAEAISRAVVDPTEARYRLDRLLPVRVPGGRLYSLDVMVWAPAITNYPVNNREATARFFPASGAAGKTEESRFSPLRPPVDAADGSARLEQYADSTEQLLWSLERSVTYLLGNNPLVETIGDQGVMLPITAVPMTIKYGDDEPEQTVLATADGSSRMASVHDILGLKPRDVVIDLPRDDRTYRGTISDALAALNRSTSEISADELRRARAIQVPARIMLRWDSDGEDMGFAKAVESLVHLLHVEPARAWDAAASLDAQADAVLAALAEKGILTHSQRKYADGMLTPDEAHDVGLGGHADERALWLLQLISSKRTNVNNAIRSGVLELTRGKRLAKKTKADIAVELALRAVRVVHKPADVKIARVALQSAYQSDSVWGKEFPKLDGDPEALRDTALEELRETGEPGPACGRLAVQGGFWLAVHGALRDTHFFAEASQRDPRSPQKILERLMGSEYGIRVLHRALIDGRDGVPLASIEESGKRRNSPTGKPLAMSNTWLRDTVVPRAGAAPTTGGDSEPEEFPTRQLRTRIRALKDSVDAVANCLDDLEAVKTGGRSLIATEGINPQEIKQMTDVFAAVQKKLVGYELAWENANNIEDDAIDELNDELGFGDADPELVG